MLLPRKGHQVRGIEVRESSGKNAIYIRTGHLNDAGELAYGRFDVCLNREELDDLLVMLEYYKKEVWPDDD